jgi:hypothetical protein
MFFGPPKGSLINHHTLYVHDDKIEGDMLVKRLRTLIQAIHYSEENSKYQAESAATPNGADRAVGAPQR